MSITINGDTGIAGVDGSNTTPSLVGNDTNTGVFFPAADTVALATGGVTRFQAGPSGQLGIAGATYGTSGQVLTSGGASAAPSWTTISTGAWVVANSVNVTSTANVIVSGLGSYTSLRITINDLRPSADGESLCMQFSSDNGSTFIGTGTYFETYTANASSSYSAGVTLLTLSGNQGVGNGATEGGYTAVMNVLNWGIAQKTTISYIVNGFNGSGNPYSFTGWGGQTGQTAMNAFRIYFVTGNVTQARILVEGWTGP